MSEIEKKRPGNGEYRRGREVHVCAGQHWKHTERRGKENVYCELQLQVEEKQLRGRGRGEEGGRKRRETENIAGEGDKASLDCSAIFPSLNLVI